MTSGGDPLRERLLRLFLEEIDERVEDLRAGLEQLAAAGPDAPENATTLETLFRSAHSLKGAAQAVGATPIAEVCHQLEDLLSDVREGTLHPDAVLLSRIDRAVGAIIEASLVLRVGDAQEAQPDSTVREGSDGPPSAASSGVVADHRLVDPAVVPAAGSVRVAPHKFDALLARAADVISAVYRSEQVVRDVADARDRLGQKAVEQRSDLRALARMAHAAADGDRASRAVDRLDRHLRDIAAEHEHLARTTSAHQRGLRAVVDGFADAAQQARMVPFVDAAAGLAWMVRELAEQTGKQARLVVDAENVEVDKPLVATLHDILGHLVRNAVDHGLEPPAERERAAKPPTGTVRVSATLVTQGIEIVVSDDGRGVAVDHVRRAAQSLGLVSQDTSHAALEEVLFHPGLTTTAQVNQYSGRGVGLDAVRSQVERAGGTVDLESTPGAGTVVKVVVPLTLSTIRAVIARVADDVVAFPSSAVRTITAVPSGRRMVAGRDVVTIGRETVPVVALSELLGWGSVGDLEVGRQVEMLVLEGAAEVVAVVVSDVLSEREILLRSAPQRLAGLSLLLGTTQLEDGAVALVLSPAACVRMGLERQRTDPVTGPEPSQTPQILLVEDTVTTRELERSILELAGYSVLVAADGVQATQLLEQHHVDAVVSDIDMPRMDGVSLCRAIRASREFAELPVILVTSLHSDADRRRGLDAGADAYLSKTGFDRGELLDALERLL